MECEVQGVMLEQGMWKRRDHGIERERQYMTSDQRQPFTLL
jgi:hypothetical protein